MKKTAILFALPLFLYADISQVITTVKTMEHYKPVFKKFPEYNIFTVKKSLIQNGIAPASPNVILKINAIFQDKANINGIWLKKGDTVYGYRVVEITDTGVVLEKDGKIKKLTIKSSLLKAE